MESDSFALRTALFSLLGLVVLATSWTILRKESGDYNLYQVTTGESVNGMALQSRVYYKGVEVGSVQDIYFQEDDFDNVKILIHVDKDIPLSQNTYAQLALRGITGEYDLRLDNDGALGGPLITSVEHPATIEMRPGYISTLGDTAENAFDEISSAGASIASVFSEGNQQEITQILKNANTAVSRFYDLEGKIMLVADQFSTTLGQLDISLQHYRVLADQLSEEAQHVGPTLEALATTSGSFTTLSHRVEQETLVEAANALRSVEQSSRALTRVIEDIRLDPQRLILGNPEHLGPGELQETSEIR